MMKIIDRLSPLLRLAAASCVILVAGAAGAAEAEGGDGYATWAGTGVVTVTPMDRPAALLAPNARTPPRPEPLADELRAELLGTDGDDADATASGKFILTAAYTVHEQQGVLTLVRPYTVHPETGIHMRGSDDGSVGVKVKVRAGGRYLLDFQVRSAEAGKYVGQIEGERREVDDPHGLLEHVLVTLEAKASGWTTVRLSRPETDFMLYAVEITRSE